MLFAVLSSSPHDLVVDDVIREFWNAGRAQAISRGSGKRILLEHDRHLDLGRAFIEAGAFTQADPSSIYASGDRRSVAPSWPRSPYGDSRPLLYQGSVRKGWERRVAESYRAISLSGPAKEDSLCRTSPPCRRLTRDRRSTTQGDAGYPLLREKIRPDLGR